MRVAVIVGLGRIRIQVQMFVEPMLVSDRVHVGGVVGASRVEVVLARRIARGFARMCPAKIDVVTRTEFLCQSQPGAVALPLVGPLKSRRH